MTVWMNTPKLPPLRWSDPYPIFNRLAIETSSRCNRECSFCPVSTGRRDYPNVFMRPTLFESICSQLEALRWDGFIEFFLLNEPLLDPGIRDKARRLRAATPKSTIYVSTNGDALGKSLDVALQRLETLYDSGVNSVNLNIYDSGEAQAAYYRTLADEAVRFGIARKNDGKYRRVPISARALHVSDMRLDRTTAERSDLLFIKTKENRVADAPEAYCARPHRHLLIRYDGKVPLCCAIDPTAPDATIVGDANVDPLVKIWNAKTLQKHRFFLQDGKRSALPDCRTCHQRMAYAHIVRRLLPERERSSK